MEAGGQDLGARAVGAEEQGGVCDDPVSSVSD